MRAKRVIIIGAGGLGVSAAWALCRAWPGDITLDLQIFDGDDVEVSNLHRQVLFEFSDLESSKQNKAELLSLRLQRLIHGKPISINPIANHVNLEELKKISSAADVVIECSDSAEIKFLAHDLCIRSQTAFCYAGANGEEGILFFCDPNDSSHACLRCLFGDDSEIDRQSFRSCSEAGILGPVAGYLGVLQANTVLRFLTNELKPGEPQGYRFSSKTWRASSIKLSRDLSCETCAQRTNSNTHLALSQLDLRSVRCPNTYLYTKLAIEKLPESGSLKVRFGNQESAENVHRSIREESKLSLSNLENISLNEWTFQITRLGK